MENDFFIQHDSGINDKPVTDTEYFTIIGKHEYIDNNKNPRVSKETPEVCAKKIVGEEKTKFYIKTGLYGKVYDPIGLFSEGTGAKFLARSGKKAWNFKQVSSRVFDMYLSFLKTKNKAWLTNAERELN
jgi:hypothetical protein